MSNGTEVAEFPLLRFRNGAQDDYFESPVQIIGHIVGVGDDVVTISIGPDATTQLYVEDLYELLGGPEDALGILVDAAAHGDLVKIKVSHERISYENDAQSARYPD